MSEMLYDIHQRDVKFRELTDRRRSEWMLFFSIILHGLLLYAIFPEFGGGIDWKPPERKIVVVRSWRPPMQEKKKRTPVKREQVEQRRKRFKPIPDPSPDEIEVEIEDLEIEPEIEQEIPDGALIVFGAPEGPPADIAAPTDGPIRITGEVVAPKPIKRVKPDYPEVARKANIQGMVILEAVILKTGKVTDPRIMRSLGKSLDEAAVKAVLQWEFTPATLNGIPVDVYMTLTVIFELEG